MAKKLTARKPSLDKLCRRGKAWAYAGKDKRKPDGRKYMRGAFVCRLPSDGKNGGRFAKLTRAGLNYQPKS